MLHGWGGCGWRPGFNPVNQGPSQGVGANAAAVALVTPWMGGAGSATAGAKGCRGGARRSPRSREFKVLMRAAPMRD